MGTRVSLQRLLLALCLLVAARSEQLPNVNSKWQFRFDKAKTAKYAVAGIGATALAAGVIHKIRALNDPAILAKKPLPELLKSGLVQVDAEKHTTVPKPFDAIANKTLLLFFDGDVEGSSLSAENRKSRLQIIRAVNTITRQLQQLGTPLVPDFEVVFMPSSKPYDAETTEELKKMAWGATTGVNPSGYAKRLGQALRKKYNVADNQVQLISLDSNYELVSDNAFPLLFTDPSRMPWPREHVHALLGQIALRDQNNQTVDLNDVIASGKDIGLLFAAGWHDKSAEYIPKLASLYEDVNRQHAKGVGKGLELIYIGSDSSAEEYEKQQQQMPWLVAAPEEERRRDLLRIGIGVTAIPTLLVLDSGGNVINDNAMLRVLANATSSGFPWPEKPAYDLNEGATTSSDGTVTSQPGWVATKLARGTTLLLLLEGVPITKQREMLEALEEVAKQHHPPAGPLMLFGNSNEKRGRDVNFVSSRHSSKLSQAIRNLCGVKPLTTEPTLVVLQLNKGRFFKKPLGAAVTPSSFKAQAKETLENLDSLKYEYIKLSSSAAAQARSAQKRPNSAPTAAPTA